MEKSLETDYQGKLIEIEEKFQNLIDGENENYANTLLDFERKRAANEKEYSENEIARLEAESKFMREFGTPVEPLIKAEYEKKRVPIEEKQANLKVCRKIAANNHECLLKKLRLGCKNEKFAAFIKFQSDVAARKEERKKAAEAAKAAELLKDNGTIE